MSCKICEVIREDQFYQLLVLSDENMSMRFDTRYFPSRLIICYFSLHCISFPNLEESHYNLLCGHYKIDHKQFGTWALFDVGI